MLTVASQHHSDSFRLLVMMGVAGCGKSTIGEALARVLGGNYIDGDAFHSASNVAKMRRSEPLTDEDRWPWLARFGRHLAQQEGIMIGGCSALKRAYRECIAKSAAERVLFVHLAGSRELIAARMSARRGHFMPTNLLDSQFDDLEVPENEENAISVNIDGTLDDVTQRICRQIERGRE